MIIPDIVLIGHLAEDAQPDGTFRLGGTVTYAALLATRLGLRVGVITSGTSIESAALRALVPGVDIILVPSETPTVFENVYHGGSRTQFLRARAADLTPDAIPDAWQTAPLVLLGPIANEVSPEIAALFPMAMVAATPQGWLRTWDETGRVSYLPWANADRVLPSLRALILSTEDLAIAAGTGDANDTITAWAARVPYVVLTDGARGANLWIDGGNPEHIPAFPAEEVDPTGAGDCFAVAMLIAFWRSGDALAAVRYAHAAASFAVRASGTLGVPTAEQIAELLD